MTPSHPFRSVSSPFGEAEFTFAEDPSGNACQIDPNDTIAFDGWEMPVDAFVEFGGDYFPDSTPTQRLYKVFGTALASREESRWLGPCISKTISPDLEEYNDGEVAGWVEGWDDGSIEILRAQANNRRIVIPVSPFGASYAVSDNCLLLSLEHLLHLDFSKFLFSNCVELHLKAGKQTDKVGWETVTPTK